jgi:hypothetical protein
MSTHKCSRTLRLSILATGLLSSSLLYANLKPPVSLPSARVLPEGVRNVSFKGVLAEGTAKYDNWGNREVLADPFFNSLDFKTIKDGTLDPLDLASIQSKMDKLGVSDSDSFGFTEGDVSVKAQVNVPVLAYGLTDRITMAVAVPVAQSSLFVSTGVIQQNRALYDLFRQELQASGVSVKLQELDDKLNDPINYKVDEYNYQALESESSTKLGDIKLIARYMTWSNDSHVLTTTTSVTMPTGKKKDINKVIDLGGGDGQWDVGLALNYDWSVTENFIVSTEIGHNVQLADRLAQRVPEKFDSSFTPDIDQNVRRSLGNESIAAMAFKWRKRGVNAGLGYALQYKTKDRYQGEAFSEIRYRWMEQDSVQNMQALSASVGYDTLTLYRRGKFPVPLSVSVGHSRVLSGKNVVVDPLTTLDFSVFF